VTGSIEDHDAPGDGAEKEADEIDGDKCSKSLPAHREEGADDLMPAEMENEESCDRKADQRADD
jgi:hypothetical protein